MKKINIKEWIPIEKINEDGIIKLKNNKYVKILKITPINYNLKSELEKKSILNSYKIFLKTCNFNIQILIQSKREDLEKHIINIRKNIQKEQNKFLENIAKDYIEFVKKLNISKKSSTKEFYIIIEENIKNKNNSYINEEILKNQLKDKYFKIKECLIRSGNSVNEISNKKDILKILFSFFNTRKNLY